MRLWMNYIPYTLRFLAVIIKSERLDGMCKKTHQADIYVLEVFYVGLSKTALHTGNLFSLKL